MIDHLRREHAAALRRIQDANRDLGERIHQLGIQATYDPDDDMLFVTLGEPQEALTESVDDCVYFRLDPDTWKIVGLEVIGVDRCLAQDARVRHLLLSILPFVQTAPPSQPVGAPTEQVADTIRELVTA